MKLLVTSLVMLLVKASLLMLRQAGLGGWEVGLRGERRWFHSRHQISNHGRGNWGHSWHHRHDSRVLKSGTS